MFKTRFLEIKEDIKQEIIKYEKLKLEDPRSVRTTYLSKQIYFENLQDVSKLESDIKTIDLFLNIWEEWYQSLGYNRKLSKELIGLKQNTEEFNVFANDSIKIERDNLVFFNPDLGYLTWEEFTDEKLYTNVIRREKNVRMETQQFEHVCPLEMRYEGLQRCYKFGQTKLKDNRYFARPIFIDTLDNELIIKSIKVK